MDGESSYESDISESWSLIDINLNEESLSVTEVPSDLEIPPVPELKNVKLKKLSETELDDFVRKCKEINQTSFSQVSDSDSSLKIEELPTSSRTKLDGIDFSSKSLENNVKNDSDDSESIEILNIDDSEVDKFYISGIDQLSTYQSEDEESLEERSNFESRSNSSTVIKRVKRINESLNDAVYSVNSENRSPAESNFSASSNNAKEESLKLIVESNKLNGHPVYKHYRNNVANTVLSLSVGVIFAGVACIAIGHFLGVQDASENAVVLVETLKKLQAENAALQSRLFHLNRALLTREMTPKLELPRNQQNSKDSCEESSHIDSSKAQKANLNNAALSEICSSLNSIEWLSRLQNFVRKNSVTNSEYEIDFKRIGKFIQEQLHSFSNGKGGGINLLEDADKKLSKVLQKIISRLSSSQDHIENFYDRLIKFKDKLNQKFKKIFPGSLKEFKPESELKKKVPVTELDLQTINWNPEKKLEGSSEKPHLESVLSHKFSQPENYYETDRNVKLTSEKVLEVTNSSRILENKSIEKEVKQNKKKHKNENQKKKEKKQSKNVWKEKKFKEKAFKEKRGNKNRKRAVNNVQRVPENFGNKNKNVFIGPKHFSDRNAFNETFFKSKKYLKLKDNNVKSKRKVLKKNSKLRKVLTKLKKRSQLKKKYYDKMCSMSECFNVTGYWVFKWADGREEIRRHQKLGDWQFERAKARKELRGEEHEENWQFKRALARETNRNDDNLYRKKYDKYVGNEFFHDRFSWI